jgi:hypothetical protein
LSGLNETADRLSSPYSILGLDEADSSIYRVSNGENRREEICEGSMAFIADGGWHGVGVGVGYCYLEVSRWSELSIGGRRWALMAKERKLRGDLITCEVMPAHARDRIRISSIHLSDMH